MPIPVAANDDLLEQLQAIGAKAELALRWAVDSLHRPDPLILGKSAELEQKINAADLRLNDTVLAQLESRHPETEDLRGILCWLRISLHFERIADYAQNILQRTDAYSAETIAKTQGALWRMGQAALKNLQAVLTAITQRDSGLAQTAWHQDADLDAHYASLVIELLPQLGQQPQAVLPATHALFIARNLERIGDHQSNIAEAVYYWLSGKRLVAQRRYYENTARLQQLSPGRLDDTANLHVNLTVTKPKAAQSG